MEYIVVVFDEKRDGINWPVPVSRVGPNLFRVAEHPDFLSDVIDFGDVFETETCGDGLRFVRVVEKSHFKRFEFTLGREILQHPAMQRIFKRVADLGGRWDFMINFLYVYVHEDAGYDPTGEIELVTRNLRRMQPDSAASSGVDEADDSTAS